eukprot:1049454-Pyramimonas_sp.AAC.1
MEEVIRHISTLATFAHHHLTASARDCPQTWSGMLGHDFALEAPMRALEVIVQPADVNQLSIGDCSICQLHKELVGSEEGLGSPHTMADLEYIGGGVAMSNRRLDEDPPASPAPGT